MSMYALPQDASQLKAFTSRTQRAGTQQHASIANVSGPDFAKGDIKFPFLVSGNKWWIPAKSYIRLRCKIRKGDGNPITEADQIGPAMGFASSLFQSAEFSIRGVSVSRLTNFVPQVDQYVKRTTTSAAYMHNALASMDYQDPSWDVRRDKWSLPPDRQGLVETHYMNASDLVVDPQTTSLAKLQVKYDPVTGGEPPLFELVTIAGAGTGWNTLNADLLRPGDRIFFNGADGIAGGGAQPPRQLTVACTIMSNNTHTAASGTWWVAMSDDSGVAIPATLLVDFENLRIERDVLVTHQRIDATTFEVCWQPPLSIFGLSHALPSMSCEMLLKGRPGSQYGFAAVNTRPAMNDQPAAAPAIMIPAGQTSAAANTYQLTVDDIFFYSYQVESDRLDSGTYMLDLEECNCSSQVLDATIGLNQKNFLVPPSTYQIGIAFQDNSAGVSTDKPIGYLGWLNRSGVAPAQVISSHTDLSRLYFQYSNQTAPQPDADPTYNMYPVQNSTPGLYTDYYTQRWLESSLHSGQHWTPGGPEDIQTWWDKGPLHIFPTLRDPVDRSTNLVVNAFFNKAPVNAAVLLFSMSRKVATIMVDNGSVQQVDVQDQ